MFRRRTSSSGKIHYRINIDKSMCPNPVDIYIDGDTYQHGFDGAYLDIYHKKIEVIRIGGQIVSKGQQYEYNVFLGTTGGVSNGTLTYLYDSGEHCDLANRELYGNRITEFTPITEIIDPEEIILRSCLRIQGNGLASILPGLPHPPTASRSFWLPSGFILKISYLCS